MPIIGAVKFSQRTVQHTADEKLVQSRKLSHMLVTVQPVQSISESLSK
jgi:hypothetical protein